MAEALKHDSDEYKMSDVNPSDAVLNSNIGPLLYFGSNFKENKTKCYQNRNYNNIVFCINEMERKVTILRFFGKKNGCSAYLGYNRFNKELLYITKWIVRYSQIESKCVWFEETKCEGCKIDNFISSIDEYVNNFSKMHHKNVIPYKYVVSFKNERKQTLTLYLAQDFISGNTVHSLTKSIGWQTEGIRTVARGVVDALGYLQRCGTSHKGLNNSTVFVDGNGVVRCKDFFLVPYLQYLISNTRSKLEAEDLPNLGRLLESFMPSLPLEIQYFVNRCKSNCALSEILKHPFLEPKTEMICVESRFDIEFNLIKKLGKGAFGNVLKATHNIDGQTYAVKKILLPGIKGELYEKTKREAALLARLNHCNVIRYFTSWFERQNSIDFDDTEESTDESMIESCSTIKSIENCKGQKIVHLPTYMYIKMEYCDFTLRQIIEDNLYLDNKKKWSLFCQLVRGLSYIHEKNIVHRDLKPENIFLNSSEVVKIGDFGHAKQIDLLNEIISKADELSDIGTDEVGTHLYVAPELIGKASQSTYDQKVDVYSLGIIFFEMNTSFQTEMERFSVITSLRNKYFISTAEMKKTIYYKARKVNAEIICWLLRHNVSDRPSSFELQCFINCNKKTVKYLGEWRKIN